MEFDVPGRDFSFCPFRDTAEPWPVEDPRELFSRAADEPLWLITDGPFLRPVDNDIIYRVC